MKPVLQAMLLADQVYVDKATGKHVIAGTFNHLRFARAVKPKTVVVDGEEREVVPRGERAGSPTVYLSLTEIRGSVDCVLRYVNLELDKVLMELKFKVACADPLRTVEAKIALPPLPNVAGTHALELLCDDEPVGSHRIIVEDVTEADENENDS